MTSREIIKVYNDDPSPITLYPFSANFTKGDGENGAPVFYSRRELRDGAGLAEWLSFDDGPVTLLTGERYDLPIMIDVPMGAQPGGHYGAIIFSTSPAGQAGGVGVSSQLAVLLLAQVAGETRDMGRIAEFGFQERMLWYNYLPIDFFLRFENDGNAYLRPIGTLTITDMFGRTVAETAVNPDGKSVLPQSIRRFEFGWRGKGPVDGDSALLHELNNFAIGPHTATLQIKYGESQQLLVDQRSFSVWPWRIMSLAAVALLIVGFLIVAAFMKYRDALLRACRIR